MKKVLDICIPAYNESGVIAATIESLWEEAQKNPHIETRIIVADNASTDTTADIVSSMKLPYVTLLRLERRGKGYAIREAAQHATGDYFAYIDADLSASPASLFSLLATLEKTQADIVVGSRLLNEKIVRRSFLRTLSSRAYNFLANLMVPVPVSDAQCGLKVMTHKGRAILREKCRENTWFLDLELLSLAKNNLRILEEPIEWVEFRYEGRQSKLRILKDGLAAILAFIRIRFRS